MTQSEYDAAVKFTADLSTLRDQINDQQLLDQCQMYLSALVPYGTDGPFDPEPEPASAPTT